MPPADLCKSPASSEALAALGYDTPPDKDGWLIREHIENGQFDDLFLSVRIRREKANARLRVQPDRRHANMNGVVHGAFLLALIDYALFTGPIALGVERVLGGATIETSTQFYNPVTLDHPIDVVAQVMQVTGRLVFSRGVIEQDGQARVGFSGIIRRRNEVDSRAQIKLFQRQRSAERGKI